MEKSLFDLLNKEKAAVYYLNCSLTRLDNCNEWINRDRIAFAESDNEVYKRVVQESILRYELEKIEVEKEVAFRKTELVNVRKEIYKCFSVLMNETAETV